MIGSEVWEYLYFISVIVQIEVVKVIKLNNLHRNALNAEVKVLSWVINLTEKKSVA